MLPPHQQPRTGVLHTSLSIVPTDGSNSDQIRDSPTESASSRETWPTADALMLSKAKDRETASALMLSVEVRNPGEENSTGSVENL